jgi:hypothetical protein
VMDPPGPLADSGAPDPVVVTAVWFVARRRFSAPNSGRTASARPQIRAVNHLAPGARAAQDPARSALNRTFRRSKEAVDICASMTCH